MSKPLLDIRFVHHRDGIKGEHADFNKFIFVAHRYRGIRPLPGEIWRCAIICDTKPENSKRGAILVRPLTRIVTPAKAASGSVTADSVLPTKQQMDVIKSNLKGERAIRIVSMKTSTKSVSAVKKHDRYNNHILLIDQKPVGLFDSWSELKIDDLPLEVKCITITLDCGTIITVHDRTIPIISDWYKRPNKRHGHPNWKPIKSRLLTPQPSPRFGGRSFSWDEVKDKQVGDALTYEYPFQWQLDWLTNGVYSFPRAVPHQKQWRELPVRAMPKDCWELFMLALEGKLLDQMYVQYQTAITKQQEAKIQRKQQEQIEQYKKQCTRKKGYQLWQGEVGCTQISIGKNLLFTVSRGSLPPLYVVDNAGVGAIYVFANETDARALASGKTTRRQAQKLSLLRLIHCAGWQQKLAEYLNN